MFILGLNIKSKSAYYAEWTLSGLYIYLDMIDLLLMHLNISSILML